MEKSKITPPSVKTADPYNAVNSKYQLQYWRIHFIKNWTDHATNYAHDSGLETSSDQ